MATTKYLLGVTASGRFKACSVAYFQPDVG
jgi:hypothetical protein